jgi:hypothetical protein
MEKRFNIRNLTYFITISGYLTSSFAETNDTALQRAIDSLVKSSMVREKVVGLAIGIVKDGKVYYKHSSHSRPHRSSFGSTGYTQAIVLSSTCLLFLWITSFLLL